MSNWTWDDFDFENGVISQMKVYATTTDVIDLRGAQPTDILNRLDSILKKCSSNLRLYARQRGVDLDKLYDTDEDIQQIIIKGVVDSSYSYLNSTTSNLPAMSQFSESVGGYSISGTFVSVGGSFYFPKNFLKTLGLKNQRVGKIEVFNYGSDKRTEC